MSNRQPNFTPKTTGKRRTKTPKIRRKEIIKIRAEINEKERKETIVKLTPDNLLIRDTAEQFTLLNFTDYTRTWSLNLAKPSEIRSFLSYVLSLPVIAKF